jgi:hypothetical protein
MESLKIGNYYAGAVDAFGYAANKLQIEVAWQIENNTQAHKYLRKNHPKTKRYYYDEHCGKHNLEWVHIITGGDPCQALIPGSEKACQMTVIAGQLCLKEYQKSGPIGLLTKMLLEQSVTWYSTKRLLIWKVSATPAKRLIFQLSALEPSTKGKEYSLLPTPMKRDAESYYVVSRQASLNRVNRQLHWVHNAILSSNLNKAWANPQFSLWLMGYPINYLDLPQLATQSKLKFQ